MAKFKKKPVEIEAVQYLGRENDWTPDNPVFTERPDWLLKALTSPGQTGGVWLVGNELYVSTLEGSMIARIGDWMIRGVKGEVYPCKPDIFEMTYDVVPE